MTQVVKNLPAMQKTWVQSLGWKGPWIRELPGVPLRGEGSCGGGGAPRDSVNCLIKDIMIFLTIQWLGLCTSTAGGLGLIPGGGAWWAAVYGVAQSWT